MGNIFVGGVTYHMVPQPRLSSLCKILNSKFRGLLEWDIVNDKIVHKVVCGYVN
jgi:hypothetical protein